MVRAEPSAAGEKAMEDKGTLDKGTLRGLTQAEVDNVAGGVSPFANPAGHKPPGQTPNPNPGK